MTVNESFSTCAVVAPYATLIRPSLAVCIVLILIGSSVAIAQPRDIAWVNAIGSPYEDAGWRLALDRNGDVLVTGQFNGSVDFGPEVLTTKNAFQDMFLAKYSYDGRCLWARQGAGPNHDYGSVVTVDAWNNVIVSGRFTDSIALGSTVLHAAGTALYIAKYSPDGELLWTSVGAGGPDVYDVTTDDNGNIYMVGLMGYWATFGDLHFTGGHYDGFLVKYTPDGKAAWAIDYGSMGDGHVGMDMAYTVLTDSEGNVYVSTMLGVRFDIEGQILEGPDNIYFAKYSPAGKALWAKSFGGPGGDIATAMTVAENGDMIMSGYVAGAVDFGGSVVQMGQFVARFRKDGSLVWAINKQSPVGTAAIHVNRVGEIYSLRSHDGFMEKFSANGDPIWTHQYAPIGTSIYHFTGDCAGNFYFIGTFTNTLPFGAPAPVSVGLGDAFFAKIHREYVLPLSQPQLRTPADQATDQPITPMLTWAHVICATRYRLQVGLDASLASRVIDTVLPGIPQHLCDSLQNDTEYFWRILAINADTISIWSDVYRFRTIIAAPDIPVLDTPVDGGRGIVVDPSLIWRAAERASHYQLQVSRDSTFKTTNLDIDSLATFTIKAGSLATNTTYYWRVRAKNKGGWSGWSSTFTFKTVIAAPQLRAPSQMATHIPTNLTLEWFSVDGAASYLVQLSDDASFQTILIEQWIDSLSLDLSGLARRMTYYWRVLASNPDGSSIWSAPWSFTTLNLPAVILRSPLDGTADIHTAVEFQWHPVVDADTYRLILTSDPTLARIDIDTSLMTTSCTIGNLENDRMYYWWVRSENANGSGAPSAVWRFRTIIALPARPDLALPANGATDVSRDLSCIWKSSARASSYTYQLSTTSDFSIIRHEESGTTRTNIALSSLSEGTDYYWRVNAMNAAGASGWSDTWTFRTAGTMAIGDVANALSQELISQAAIAPNPVNTHAAIHIITNKPCFLTMTLRDILGRVVVHISEDLYSRQGSHEYRFEAATLTRGLYFVQIQARSLDGSAQQTRTMLLAKPGYSY